MPLAIRCGPGITLNHPDCRSANASEAGSGRVLVALMNRPKSFKIKVLAVDDHPLMLAGIRACLREQAQFDLVGVAANGEEAILMARQFSPDVVLMGVVMPGIDGLETARLLQLDCPKVKVLMFAERKGTDAMPEMIRSGVKGCLLKTASQAELLAALERVYRGQTCFSPGVAQAFFDEYVRRGGQVQEAEPQRISERERQVLFLLVNGSANKDTAQALHISVRTVEKHRQRLMKKLGVHKATELVRVAITTGLVSVGHD